MRVLIVKTSSMGDVLHTLPALTDAQQAIPGIKFDWVVEEGFAQIPSWHAAVERVIPVAIRRWRKAWFSAPIKAERKAFREALQAENYDAVIDAQGLVKSAALVTRLAHGVKHGLDWQTAREPLASLFYNRKHHIAKQQHAVERTRELFAKSLGYSKPQTQGDYAIAQHFLTNLPTDAGEYAVFLHATTRDDKHWPEEHWRELIGLLADSPASSPDTPTSAWRRYPGWPPPLAERPFLHTSTAPPSLFWGCLACGCRSWDSRWRKYPANARRSSASARTWPGFGSSPTLTPTTWIRSGRRSTPWSCRSGRLPPFSIGCRVQGKFFSLQT